MITHAGKVYRVGGMQPRNEPGDKADNFSLTDCARFDPARKVWEPLPPLPHMGSHPKAYAKEADDHLARTEAHERGTALAFFTALFDAGSALAGQRLGDLRLSEEHRVSVIGQWFGGVFTTTKGPDTRIEPGAILVIVGAPDNLEKVERMAMPIRRTGPIVLAGYGAVGNKVREILTDSGETCVVIDRLAAPGVDVVGNILETSTLERAGVRDASAVILALSDGDLVRDAHVVGVVGRRNWMMRRR